jgi:sortase A
MSRARSPRWSSLARTCERLLFGLGACCLVIYAAACTHRSLSQAREEAVFEEALVEQKKRINDDPALLASIQAEEHDRSGWSVERVRYFEQVAEKPVQALGRLVVPDASVSVMLLEGTDELTLNRAVGRIEGTARPGEAGNLGVAGHRDSFFRGLRHVRMGHSLSLTTLEGIAHYEVESIVIVEPSDVEVLEPTDYPSITLVTCYPFYFVGDAPKRYIVHGRQVRFEPWAAAAGVAASPPREGGTRSLTATEVASESASGGGS